MKTPKSAKVLICALSLALAASAAAQAQTRPFTTTMQCRAANALVMSQGAVVLYSSRDIYDRFVAGQNFCGPGMTTRAAFVPTADSSQCFVGYLCFAPSYDRN